MRKHGKSFTGMAPMALLFLVLGCGGLAAQARAPRAQAMPPSALTGEAANPEATQRQLVELLRMSPKLTSVVARDPELLADQAYIQRNNPELEQFLQSHPEVTRNPEFYLFSNLGPGSREQRLQQELWPERMQVQVVPWDSILPFFVFVLILSALLWLVRVLLENRRWNRIFRVQTEMQAKLLERFGSSDELLTFLRTEEGRRALELPPVPVASDLGLRVGSPVGRVLTSLQVGILLALAGGGLLYLRSSFTADAAQPLLIFGTLALVLGVGFILSAGISFVLARHLGLLPQNPAKTSNGGAQILNRL